jgi:hypothetical protein
LDEIKSNKNLSWSTHEEVCLLDCDGINKTIDEQGGLRDQVVLSGKNMMGDMVLEDKAWYVVVHTPQQKRTPKDRCWVHLTGVLVDHCDELLWYIFHTCENRNDKDSFVEKLDEYVDIRTNCRIRKVGAT